MGIIAHKKFAVDCSFGQLLYKDHAGREARMGFTMGHCGCAQVA